MRLRNIRGSEETVAQDRYVVNEPEQLKGKWVSLFQNENPIHMEIGMGKGKFIMEQSRLHPENNYIGIERYASVLLRALEKRKQTELNNLYYIWFDAQQLNDIVGTGEISKIYLNFSDPWPKDRHAKRRLTSREFLSKYQKCLKKDGEVIFKTDNQDLFAFSLEEAKAVGWQLKEVTYDLHHSDLVQGNVMTEYEERFVMEGKPICQMILFQN